MNHIDNDLVNPIRISRQFIIIIIGSNGCYGLMCIYYIGIIIIILICVSCIIIITSLYNIRSLGEGRLATVRTSLSREGFSLLVYIYYVPTYIFSSDSSIVSENRFFVFRSVSTVHNIIIVTIHLSHKRAQR